MKLAKKIKKVIVVLLCISMVMTNILPSFADGNNESEPVIEEVIENKTEEVEEDKIEEDRSYEFLDEEVKDEHKEVEDKLEEVDDEPFVEEIENDDCKEELKEDIVEEPEEGVVEEPEEDVVEEPEEDVVEEPEEDVVEEPEEDVVEEPEEEVVEELKKDLIDDIPEEIEEKCISSPSEITDEENEDIDYFMNELEEELEEDLKEENLSSSDTEAKDNEEIVFQGSVASPSDTEGIEAVIFEEIEEKVEESEATPSEIEKLPMFAMMPMNMLGTSATVTSWDELKTSIANSSPGDTITLGSYISVLDTYEVQSDKDVIIDLNGNEINGNEQTIFTLKGKITIKDSGSGVKINGTGSEPTAISIKDSGILILDKGTFTNWTNGVVGIDDNGTFIMNDGKISGNTASSGACIYMQNGTFIMNGGEISNNSTGSYGGGIFANNGNVYLNGGKIINNSANKGAGIYVNGDCEKVYLGGSIVVKDNGNSSSGEISNIFLENNNPKLEISSTTPLTSDAEIYVTVEYDIAGDWGPGKSVGQYFNGTMTDSNYRYFHFTNCGSVEKDVVYDVKKVVAIMLPQLHLYVK